MSYRTSSCKGCGKPIVWVRVLGKPIPCDPRPPVYLITEDLDSSEYVGERRRDALVSHFATCTEVQQFSRGGKG